MCLISTLHRIIRTSSGCRNERPGSRIQEALLVAEVRKPSTGKSCVACPPAVLCYSQLNKSPLMLHVWLVPALAVLVIVLVGFYVVLKFTGGAGDRKEGRTVVDKEEPPPPTE